MRIINSKTHGVPAGFAVIPAVIILFLVLTFGLAVINMALTGRQAGKRLQESMTAGQIAEAGIQKAIFCTNATTGTNCGGTYGGTYAGETDVSFGGGKFTTVVSISGTDRTVTSTGYSPAGNPATIKVDLTLLPPTDDPSFSYALQTGAGGAYMANNSSISGTIYSNGDIVCNSTNAIVTGDAYSAKSGGKIEKCKVLFHAHADKILNSDVEGDAYYLNNPADISGTTVLGAKYASSDTPALTTLPDVNLPFWRDSAEAGGIYVGNYSPADNSDLGPLKISGDLIMNNNVDVNITGPVWVMGNIVTGNNTTFALDPDFGSLSTVILADDPADLTNHGKIDITNNTSISGSGNPQSHILFVSTNNSLNDASPALQVSNNAAGAIFLATSGTMRLANNAGAKSLAGYRLYLDENSDVNYVESEFAGLFSNSPSNRWRLLEGSWREVK
ncbi:hypothetical protein A3C96_00695 [Candidatus Uhrbacteria bacterium RIFCSPHIGHO2_02_FULL_60_10]|uniref:Uncharacterized protein n=1 Tax=Candidatus Uhrbacteria bacterium RIFCSPHIGHO2_02_FULL_60_10 TaxID=1802392 RepID=A0A1F7U701_9BACT|nr:MAG: hypothetical protein A3C96_00695 [Candidatus Uhrbacteria bacterium RIFCSPHIGHO2_02_FULL_60_10]